jgi:hypothetical protein
MPTIGQTTRVYHYVCNRQINQYPVLPKGACRNRCRGDVLEQIAWRYVMDIFSDEELFERKLREAQQAETESVRPLQEQLELVNELITQKGKLANSLQRLPLPKEAGSWKRLFANRPTRSR